MEKKDLCNPTIVSNDKQLFEHRQNTIRKIKKYGIAAGGRSELIEHLQGRRLYASKAIRAFCYDCMAWYADGKKDCREENCPLYPFMPYKTPSDTSISSDASKTQEGGGVIVRSDLPVTHMKGDSICA